MAQEYEYHVVAAHTLGEIEAAVNALAVSGWELIGEVVHDCHEEGGIETIHGRSHVECFIATLKRRIV